MGKRRKESARLLPEREWVVRMRLEGMTAREISCKGRIGLTTVYRWLCQWRTKAGLSHGCFLRKTMSKTRTQALNINNISSHKMFSGIINSHLLTREIFFHYLWTYCDSLSYNQYIKNTMQIYHILWHMHYEAANHAIYSSLESEVDSNHQMNLCAK